jgi:RAT1-interacting protein
MFQIPRLAGSFALLHKFRPGFISLSIQLRISPWHPILRYVAPTQFPKDLGAGFDANQSHRDDEPKNCGINPILHSLADNSVKLDDVHFVSFRNNFNKILNTAMSTTDSWCFACTRIGGVIFLDVREAGPRQTTYFSRRGAYCGRKFEEMCVMRNGSDVEYCTVVSSRLGRHKIILAAELDCRDDRGTLLELKTSQIPKGPNGFTNFNRNKLSKWWVQSFLVGVPSIVCGFMKDGTLERIQHYETMQLPKISGGQFDYRIMLQFTDNFLTWLQASVLENRQYMVTFRPTQKRGRGGVSEPDDHMIRVSISEDVHQAQPVFDSESLAHLRKLFPNKDIHLPEGLNLE